MTKVKNVLVNADKEIGMEEALKILGLEPILVRRSIETGTLRSKKISGEITMLLSDVLSYKARKKAQSKALEFLVQVGQEVERGYEWGK